MLRTFWASMPLLSNPQANAWNNMYKLWAAVVERRAEKITLMYGVDAEELGAGANQRVRRPEPTHPILGLRCP